MSIATEQVQSSIVEFLPKEGVPPIFTIEAGPIIRDALGEQRPHSLLSEKALSGEAPRQVMSIQLEEEPEREASSTRVRRLLKVGFDGETISSIVDHRAIRVRPESSHGDTSAYLSSRRVLDAPHGSTGSECLRFIHVADFVSLTRTLPSGELKVIDPCQIPMQREATAQEKHLFNSLSMSERLGGEDSSLEGLIGFRV